METNIQTLLKDFLDTGLKVLAIRHASLNPELNDFLARFSIQPNNGYLVIHRLDADMILKYINRDVNTEHQRADMQNTMDNIWRIYG